MLRENPENAEYNILVISDLHFGSYKKVFQSEKLFNYLDSIKDTVNFPQLLITLGDITDTGSREEFEEFSNFVNDLESKYNIKVYNLFGNHDCYNSDGKIGKHSVIRMNRFINLKQTILVFIV